MSKSKNTMKTPITYKRPIVLEVSAFQKFPTKRSIIAATVPFRPEDSYPKHVSNVIKQTKRKWAWFSTARARDDGLGTRLGTLNYLPIEIRHQIYDCVVHTFHIYYEIYNVNTKIWSYAGRTKWIEDAWMFDLRHSAQDRLAAPGNPCVWEYNSYWKDYPEGSLATFRLTSRTIKAEYEHWFLRSHEFAFDTPDAYREFMDQLNAEQRGWIRRVKIEVYSRDIGRDVSDKDANAEWMAVCDGLPLGVEMVTLLLGYHCRLKVPRRYASGFRRTSKEINNVTRAAEVLSTMRKRILRRVPDVQTEFGGWEYDHMIPEDKDTVRRAWEEDVDLGNGILGRVVLKERYSNGMFH